MSLGDDLPQIDAPHCRLNQFAAIYAAGVNLRGFRVTVTMQRHNLILGASGFGEDRTYRLADAMRQVIRQPGVTAPGTEAVAEAVL